MPILTENLPPEEGTLPEVLLKALEALLQAVDTHTEAADMIVGYRIGVIFSNGDEIFIEGDKAETDDD